MPKHDNDIIVQVSPEALKTAALGVISGLRSMAGPALLARAAARGDVGGLEGTRFAALGSDVVATAFQILMVGEMGGDKTPFVPSRVSAGPLFGRALSGALVGSALFASGGRRGIAGALLGGASAVGGVYAADRLRSAATQNLGLPDPVYGLIEDSIILLGGNRLLRG